MQQRIFEIVENKPLTANVWKMTLRGDTSAISHAGQFVGIALEGHYLRRPISICDYDAESLTLIYKVVGEGTAQMATMETGEKLDLLTGLGNGFSDQRDCQTPLLVGGGVGVPPLYNLAKRLLARGCKVQVVLGFNRADEVFLADEFRSLGCSVTLASADGSVGIKGFVTDAIREAKIDFDYFYACGPVPMLKALCEATDCDGEVSMEERMGCGFGVCMGCTCHTKAGAERVCKEGPVFGRNEIEF